MTHAFDLDPCTGIMFGYEESAPFTLGQKIVSGEKIAGNGLVETWFLCFGRLQVFLRDAAAEFDGAGGRFARTTFMWLNA